MVKLSFNVLKSAYETEKTGVLKSLKDSKANKSIRKFNKEKHVFIVDNNANKKDIKIAFESMFDAAVDSVNTLLVKPKMKRARSKKSNPGKTKLFKKAIITLKEGSSIGVNFSKIGNTK